MSNSEAGKRLIDAAQWQWPTEVMLEDAIAEIQQETKSAIIAAIEKLPDQWGPSDRDGYIEKRAVLDAIKKGVSAMTAERDPRQDDAWVAAAWAEDETRQRGLTADALVMAVRNFLAAWPNIRNHPNVAEPSEVRDLRIALRRHQEGER